MYVNSSQKCHDSIHQLVSRDNVVHVNVNVKPQIGAMCRIPRVHRLTQHYYIMCGGYSQFFFCLKRSTVAAIKIEVT